MAAIEFKGFLKMTAKGTFNEFVRLSSGQIFPIITLKSLN